MALTELAHARRVAVEPNPFSHLRVLIAHDWIVAWAGSERCVEQMLHVLPHADLVVGVLSEKMRNFNHVTRRARETWLGRIPAARKHHRWFLPLEGLAFATLDATQYDLIISSSHAFAKMIRKGPGATHLCYCYSPPRYLWDLLDTYKTHAGFPERLALTLGGGFLRALDKRSANGVDQFVGISGLVADRIRRLYKRDAEVVYPPVSAKISTPPSRQRGDFLLSLGRLVGYKRIDLAIAAAERLQMRLVVAGTGPERRSLERLAGRTVEFLGEVSERDAGALLSQCRAFLFCGEEDFGIAPVEANAHGAPVVYLRRGGVAETMVPGVTGIPFDEPVPTAVVEAVRRAIDTPWSVEAMQRNARRFVPERFRTEFSDSLSRVLRRSERHEPAALHLEARLQ